MHYLLPLQLLLLLIAPYQVNTTFIAGDMNEGLIHLFESLGDLNQATRAISNGSPQAACSNLPEIFSLADTTKRFKSAIIPIITASKTLTPESGGLVLRDLKMVKEEYKKLAMTICRRNDIAEACGVSYGHIRAHIVADMELLEKRLSGLVRIAVIYNKDEVEGAFNSIVRLFIPLYSSSALELLTPPEDYTSSK
ncbi:hypothetical protein HOY80DRAFT_1115440 [Tuber brumale]|nr:hypothetical protein HOY80DRAFT_1115440 [Tuber brumale]